MDDDQFKQWEDELSERRKKRKKRYRSVHEDKEPGPDSCFVKAGGRTRHGRPCLNNGHDKFGGGCWQHPVGDEYEPRHANKPRPMNDNNTKTKHGKLGELMKMLEEQDIPLEDFVAKLTPEELARGQLLAEDGTFKGHPPKWVPRAFMQACVKELMKRGEQLYKGNYVAAIEVMIGLAHSPDVESAVRLRAAQFVIERIEGKTPDKIILETRDSFAVRVEELQAEMAEDEQLQRVKARYATEPSAEASG